MKKDLKIDDQKWRKNVKRSIKFFYFVAAIPLLLSMASAKEPVMEKSTPSFEQGQTAKETEMTCGYNASSRIDVNGAWDVFINGSYILWQPRQSGLEIAIKHATLPANTSSDVPMDFDFFSGFKVAFGTNLNHDNWMAIAEYMRLHTRNHVSSTVDGVNYILMPLCAPFTGSVTAPASLSADGHWQLKYDMIDLSFCRPCYVGTHLTFKPFFGLRGGWIDQHLDVRYVTLTGSTVDSWNKENTWLIGPRAGIGMNWLLGAGFRLLANGAGSLNYQNLEPRHTESVGTVMVVTTAKEEDHQLCPNLEGDFGFGWGTYFDNNNWHFDLLASYHFEVYWDQNNMRSLRDELNGGVYSKPGALNLHGLTVTAQLDF